MKRIETWPRWAERVGLDTGKLPSVDDARQELEEIVARLNQKYDADAVLPWQARQPRPQKRRQISITRASANPGRRDQVRSGADRQGLSYAKEVARRPREEIMTTGKSRGVTLTISRASTASAPVLRLRP